MQTKNIINILVMNFKNNSCKPGLSLFIFLVFFMFLINAIIHEQCAEPRLGTQEPVTGYLSSKQLVSQITQLCKFLNGY